MSLFLGLDLGAVSCDAVVIDEDGSLRGFSVVPTGARHIEASKKATSEVLEKAKTTMKDVVCVVTTGYGRDLWADKAFSATEITCHAKGIRYLFPDTEVLIDIGGQDSKVIRIGNAGKVVDFAMNDRCAAGTGRFLEVMAHALDLEVTMLQTMDEKARHDLSLTTMCTVFAETEVVGLVAQGVDVPDIVRAIHKAIALRTKGLVRRVAKDVSSLKVSMSGGVARNKAVVRALSNMLSCDIRVPEHPDIVGALGAALLGLEHQRKV
jgi:predicted CoA-substrate-specific enzyme activase